MRKLVLALLCGACAAGTAQAQWYNQAPQPSRYYFGLAAASADSDFKGTRVATGGDNGWNTSFKAFAGIDYDPFAGVELGYTDLRTDDYTYTANGVNGRVSSRGYGIYLAGKARYPIPNFPQAEVYGKLGIEYSHRRLGMGPFLNIGAQDDTGLYAGVGAQWNFNPQWAAVAEYERYGRSKRIGSGADVLTVGVRMNF